jgi:hypothetical protein
MTLIDPTTLRKFIKLALRPLVKVCLKNAVKLPEIVDCIKEVLVEESQNLLKEKNNKFNSSRISLMTGVHRRDIKKITNKTSELGEKANIITKILNQWQANPKFTNKNGTSKILSLEDDNNEFQELVFSVSKEFNPAALLFELERVEAVERTARGIKLIKKEFIPSADIAESLGILAEDCSDLFNAVEENILTKQDLPNLHRRTFFDNIVPEAIPKIKLWLMEEGIRFHKKAREMLEEYDRDYNPKLAKSENHKKVKVVLGAFSKVYEEDR